VFQYLFQLGVLLRLAKGMVWNRILFLWIRHRLRTNRRSGAFFGRIFGVFFWQGFDRVTGYHGLRGVHWLGDFWFLRRGLLKGPAKSRALL
jgi:hypothetical protein